MIKKTVIKILGYIIEQFHRLYCRYKMIDYKQVTGGGIQYPYVIAGISNISADKSSSIGPGATLYSTGAKIIIKSHVIAGPNLTIITGDHKYIVGRFIDSIAASEKESSYDQDVIIEDDVWIGTNVTILKGVTVGRSSIIAAGAVVLKNVPPYSIVAGVPAKVIKYKWNENDILSHDEFLKSSGLLES